MQAVVLDLFGTVLPAPTSADRAAAAACLATAAGREPSAVENYLLDTWRPRHDGTLSTLNYLAADLVRVLHAGRAVVNAVAEEFGRLGQARLKPSPSVVTVLRMLRARGLRLGVLSDASAEVATAWPRSPLSELVDAAVFSCQSGCVKPDQRLYRRVRDELAVQSEHVLYVGDGGGDELAGALVAGMSAVAVRRRGPGDTLAFGARDWDGPVLEAVEHLPAYLAGLR